MTESELRKLLRQGEGPALEFKRSTGELRDAMKTLCAFLNSKGGVVLFGVNPKGKPEGQQVSEQTIHETTEAFSRLEPPAHIKVHRIRAGSGRQVIALAVDANHEAIPFTYDGRAYERIGNTTRKMSQERYEALLLERAHARRRWENQPAVEQKLKELDKEEILQTRETAIRQRRISAETGADIGDILDRLGLRRNGVVTQAAQVLYGTRFMPDYPQCLLKMGRFRGTKVTDDILDNKQEHLSAFAMVREGMAFLDRTLPLAARFPEGRVNREDRLLVPPNALREILLNAVIHRDYSDSSGHVAIAVFDDRVEIRSAGRLPVGMTVEMLSGQHLSKLRNPLIADVFHRTGAVEVWGRGTNRVIEECRRYGNEAPTFEEKQGYLVVTFKAPVAIVSEKMSEKMSEKVSEKILAILVNRPETTIAELAREIGITSRTIERRLKALQDEHRLRRIGSDKGGHWEVVGLKVDAATKIGRAVSEKMSEKMSEKILAKIADRPEATIAELADEIGVTTRTVERGLKTLQEKRRLKRIGPDKGGYWDVVR